MKKFKIKLGTIVVRELEVLANSEEQAVENARKINKDFLERNSYAIQALQVYMRDG